MDGDSRRVTVSDNLIPPSKRAPNQNPSTKLYSGMYEGNPYKLNQAFLFLVRYVSPTKKACKTFLVIERPFTLSFRSESFGAINFSLLI